METVAQVVTEGRQKKLIPTYLADDQSNDLILHGHDFVWLGNDSWADGFDWMAGITWAGNVTAATPTEIYQRTGLTGCPPIILLIEASL